MMDRVIRFVIVANGFECRVLAFPSIDRVVLRNCLTREQRIVTWSEFVATYLGGDLRILAEPKGHA